MVEKMDKARKHVALWAEDVRKLKKLSEDTGKTQVELVHEAILALLKTYGATEEVGHGIA